MISRLVNWIVGNKPPLPSKKVEVPEELRQASHRMSTAAANTQGLASRLNRERERDALKGLVGLMQDGPQ